MSFDIEGLREAISHHETVVRVVIVEVSGSAPREVGASMLVWKNGQSGTIGGGGLEWNATHTARKLFTGGKLLERIPLGPNLGQCCGGSVALFYECYTEERLKGLHTGAVVRRITGTSPLPQNISNLTALSHNGDRTLKPLFSQGWFFEPPTSPHRPVWIFGAGHVGRALAEILSPLPDFAVTLIDTDSSRYPSKLPANCRQLIARNPADAVKYAPKNAENLIMTYSHTFDLQICDAVLRGSFLETGLIGSKTKWARFRIRLRQLGHSDAQIARIRCPIGQPELGKHPQAIAVGVASALLSRSGEVESVEGMVG